MKKWTDALIIKLWLLITLAFQISAFGQDNTGTVTGTVISENGSMLPGVTVAASNVNDRSETYNAITNEKGVFVLNRLKVGSLYNFTISYIGYETAMVNRFSVKEKSNSILVKLNLSDQPLDQVVVIGYGTQRRE